MPKKTSRIKAERDAPAPHGPCFPARFLAVNPSPKGRAPTFEEAELTIHAVAMAQCTCSPWAKKRVVKLQRMHDAGNPWGLYTALSDAMNSGALNHGWGPVPRWALEVLLERAHPDYEKRTPSGGQHARWETRRNAWRSDFVAFAVCDAIRKRDPGSSSNAVFLRAAAKLDMVSENDAKDLRTRAVERIRKIHKRTAERIRKYGYDGMFGVIYDTNDLPEKVRELIDPSALARDRRAERMARERDRSERLAAKIGTS